jgi:hypothetical protein
MAPIWDSSHPAKTYDMDLRIRVGMDEDKKELTMRFFERRASDANESTPARSAGYYSKVYIGLTDGTSSQSKIKTWDARYKDIAATKRKGHIKEDWLAIFKTLDRKEQDETPRKKKAKTSHEDTTIKTFVNGEGLANECLERIGKDLAAYNRLKEVPPVASVDDHT